MGRASVLVGMSGGVDSSVAACLLAEQGYEVVGCHLELVRDAAGLDHGCCGPTARADAAAVAAIAGFPFEVVDLRTTFADTVLADFVAEHAAGRTPNPCARCNEEIKFGAFLGLADERGIDLVATGHYVRAVDDDGTWRLHRGSDPAKDQSYMLAGIGQRALSRSRFPIGGMPKTETRAHAERLGLPVAAKPDSQEICFVADGDHAGFLAGLAPELLRDGEVVDVEGRTLAHHDGVARFTVGQRRGLGVSTPTPSYVLELDADRNRVVVGPGELLARTRIEADRVRWVADAPPADGPFEAHVQLRYRGESVPAVVVARGDALEVELRRAQRGVAPGQVIAVYRDDELLGGARIVRSA
jgi:tRNA-specific 2-thiouridylase